MITRFFEIAGEIADGFFAGLVPDQYPSEARDPQAELWPRWHPGKRRDSNDPGTQPGYKPDWAKPEE